MVMTGNGTLYGATAAQISMPPSGTIFEITTK